MATLNKDEKVLSIASREHAAAEAHYHKTCYHAHTRDDIRPDSSAVNLDDEEQAYADVEHNAYELPHADIRADLFASPRLVSTTYLTKTCHVYGLSWGCRSEKTNQESYLSETSGGNSKIA